MFFFFNIIKRFKNYLKALNHQILLIALKLEIDQILLQKNNYKKIQKNNKISSNNNNKNYYKGNQKRKYNKN